jgi:hypothetical protein
MGAVWPLELNTEGSFSSFLGLKKWMFELQRSTLNKHPFYFSRSDALSTFRAIFFPWTSRSANHAI